LPSDGQLAVAWAAALSITAADVKYLMFSDATSADHEPGKQDAASAEHD